MYDGDIIAVVKRTAQLDLFADNRLGVVQYVAESHAALPAWPREQWVVIVLN